MKNIIKVLIFILSCMLFSCQQKEIFSKEKLIGKWETINEKQFPIVLKISENVIFRFENGNKIVYEKYYISGDTLILEKNKLKEKHLIEILTSSKLRLGTIHSYQKDIELIDAVEFKR